VGFHQWRRSASESDICGADGTGIAILLEYTQQRYATHDEYPFDPLPAQSGDELNHESLVKRIIARTVMFEFISKLVLRAGTNGNRSQRDQLLLNGS
jgi:hypothetical protein